jgi:hypothetical protein
MNTIITFVTTKKGVIRKSATVLSVAIVVAHFVVTSCIAGSLVVRKNIERETTLIKSEIALLESDFLSAGKESAHEYASMAFVKNRPEYVKRTSYVALTR